MTFVFEPLHKPSHLQGTRVTPTVMPKICILRVRHLGDDCLAGKIHLILFVHKNRQHGPHREGAARKQGVPTHSHSPHHPPPSGVERSEICHAASQSVRILSKKIVPSKEEGGVVEHADKCYSGKV
eukprot:CCRYP_021125-RA/>CCRYP_021125-RA protein AED:0.00 eAED:0.00 QI:181/1/1/1/0/0/2/1621/125